MIRLSVLVAFVVLGALAVPLSATAEGSQEFVAQFHDAGPCPPGIDDCGKGTVRHFGTVTTTLVFTGFSPGPGANCVTGTGIRRVILDSDGSALVLALAGTICDQKIAATFTVVGGTGIFAGAAGGGTFWGVAIPGVPGDTVHYRGTITL